MKRDYKEKGYSILACSDHNHLRTHNDLTEPDFLMMTAYEISFRTNEDPRSNAFKKIVDINLLAKDPNQTKHMSGYFNNTFYAGTGATCAKLNEIRIYPA